MKTNLKDPAMPSKISPCLWFDHQAEAAAQFYASIFKDSKIAAISRYPSAGQEIHGRAAGSVMTVEFELNGQSFTALNGGPQFKFTEAISFQIECQTQAELDYYWGKASPKAAILRHSSVAGSKDRFGVSWQVVPAILPGLVGAHDTAAAQRVFNAMMQMKKLDISLLQRAFAG